MMTPSSPSAIRRAVFNDLLLLNSRNPRALQLTEEKEKKAAANLGRDLNDRLAEEAKESTRRVNDDD